MIIDATDRQQHQNGGVGSVEQRPRLFVRTPAFRQRGSNIAIYGGGFSISNSGLQCSTSNIQNTILQCLIRTKHKGIWVISADTALREREAPLSYQDCQWWYLKGCRAHATGQERTHKTSRAQHVSAGYSRSTIWKAINRGSSAVLNQLSARQSGIVARVR